MGFLIHARRRPADRSGELKLFFPQRRRKSERTLMPDSRETPGLRLHTSNRLESLVAALSEVTRVPLSSPFRKETIVVQSQGMARWLKHEMACLNGICAHGAFPFPKAFVQETCRALLPELPRESPLDPEPLTWRVLKSLRGLKNSPAFAPLQRYLVGDASGRKEVQIAGKLAHLFDQYFIFRPPWMEAWSRGAGDHWQAELWRTVANGTQATQPALLATEFSARFRAATVLPETLPERVSIFGISALPPFYLEFFSLLGERMPVHLFLLQPSEKYWGDITSAREDERLLRQSKLDDATAFQLHLETGNRLLASLGYLGRDFLKLVLEAGDWIHLERFEPVEETSLLRCIQSDILNLRDRGREDAPRRMLPAGDDSIQIHSCHSPLREMEVLYDGMLDWFQCDPHLAPRDIVVMMPDIDTYAPFVQAVFGSPEDEAKRIPFSLADRGARRESHLVETFLHILQLPQTRLGASMVLAPLETAAVRDRFQIAERDLRLIRRWIEETNIRWGSDGEYRAELGLPALDGNTWRDGLDRLVLGYAMNAGGEQLFASRLPYPDIEGDTANVLGRFAEYLESILSSVADLKSAHRSLKDWAAALRGLLDRFFLTEDDSEREAQAIRAALRELERQQELSGFDEVIALPVLLERLLPRLEEDHFASGFLTGGVTFCGLKPMRSIPFKVICLVGMNDSAFPRPASHLSFDLMAKEPRLGDRSTREDDRYLFLETLLSARERLYLSYVGQSIRDNAEAPPSGLVSELLDYVEQGFELEPRTPARREREQTGSERAESEFGVPDESIRAQRITRHRLQAFSEDYFKPGHRLFSYSAANCRASIIAAGPRNGDAASFFQEPISEPEAEFRNITLDDLAEFFVNPARFFLSHRLNVRLRDDHSELLEREPFVLDTLETYQLRQDLVARHISGGTADALSILKAGGQLPLGTPGEAVFQENNRLAEEFSRRVRQEIGGGFFDTVPFDCTIGGFRIYGHIDGLTARGLVRYRCAGLKAKDLLRAWVLHLAANILQPGTAARLIDIEKAFLLRPCVDARVVLEKLLQHYRNGLRAPLRFFPESALLFAEKARKARGPRGVRPFSAARMKWEGNRSSQSDPRGERDDPCFKLCFREPDPLNEEFGRLACAVYDPILDHLDSSAK
jgi:exodeoxyribonuclease V gamma subunit